MALYLVQHGKSLDSGTDPGLSPEGRADTERIAGVAADYQVRVGVIRHSPKARARETAALLAAALHPPRGVAETAGLKPMDDVVSFAGGIHPESDTMLVGHLPFLGRMLSHLVTGSAETPVFAFQNSGIVCLDREGDASSWLIKWTLMPAIGRP